MQARIFDPAQRALTRIMRATWALLCIGLASCAGLHRAQEPRPNIILILTDDQGHGDLGVHGNPKIRTPYLDAFTRQGVRMVHFYVSPVCAPTRASLMTGRYYYRTGVVDTFAGRALMHPDETTLAEMLSAAGYRTGIFGKWHLGDDYPLRPTDQGFQEALVHRGGGIGQPAGPPGNSYFDPVLQHNGRPVRKKGYCSDIFTDAAIEFLSAEPSRPFFLYLPFNCPHTPLQVPDEYLRKYPGLEETTARVYGMVTNIDDNLGRLFAALDERGLSNNTIVVFLTDNGPEQVRYNSGLRGRKGMVSDGGIRVPCYVRWPSKFPAGASVEAIAAHIDLAPTLLDACGVAAEAEFDGVSLLPLLRGGQGGAPDRELFFQWHRGDAPERHRAFAVRSQRWKLVRAEEPWGPRAEVVPPVQLFDMAADPFEKNDLAAERPDIVRRMMKSYETWFDDVCSTRGFDPIRIHLGSPRQEEVTLTRQDWRGPEARRWPDGFGHWEVEVARPGTYEITVRFPPAKSDGAARVSVGEVSVTRSVGKGAERRTFDPVRLPAGPARLEAMLEGKDGVKPAYYVDVKFIE